MKTILILESSPARLREFEAVAASLGGEFTLRAWQDASVMARECLDCLGTAALISLGHEGRRKDAETPGNGLQAAKGLAGFPPVCPVIVHTVVEDRSLVHAQ